MGNGLSSKELLLRRAAINDCDDIFRWRNDEVTRKNSFNSEVIPYEEHCRWFKNALSDISKLLFIGVDENNEKCGVIRFDIKNSLASEMHINVAPGKRRKGLGTKLIEKSCNLFFTENKSNLVFARIKEENIISAKAFLKASFYEVFRYSDSKSGKEVIVMIRIEPLRDIIS